MKLTGGIETCHELRTLNSRVPIVICSGYGVEEILENIAMKVDKL